MVKTVQVTRFVSGAVFAAILLVNALPLAARSQSPAAVDDSGTVNEPVPAIISTPKKKWFSVERLSGNVEVGDFVVGPGRAELEIEAGQTATFIMSVSNRVSNDRKFNLTVEDVSGSQDVNNSVVLLGDEIGPYSIKNFISFPEDSFEIGLGERANIPVTITIPANADPGGYYGSVLVSTVQIERTKENESQATPSTPIVARVGTLFFITVPGEIDVSGQLKDVTLVHDKLWYEKGPVNVGLVFENTGSLHLNPYGELRIKNMLGEEVGFVEIEPWFVLPKSLRLREISWNREFLLGRYTVTAKINRGYDDIVDEMTISFWVLPWKILLGVFLGVFFVLFIIRTFFRTFEFKRR